MRFLIVEDDPVIGEHIRSGLVQVGYSADLACTGADAVNALDSVAFDAVVLDLTLPDTGGLELLHAWRAQDRSLPPVLIVSALSSVTERIAGLDAGADDYLTKPFELTELVARLHAITRRAVPRSDSAEIVVGGLSLVPDSHAATFAGRSIQLNRKLYSLLAHMMRNADRVVTRDMLIQQVWGYSFVPATNIVESNMSRLRAQLLQFGRDPIETVRGSGYILRAERCV